jgi:UDPglucose 6-dehydrogenase
VEYSADPYACAKDASAVVIITEWDDFRALDMKRLKSVMAEPVVVDLRNIYRPDDMRKLGFKYTSIGRP